ncbi:trans-sulfuration enzyme family protein [Mucilaginibacter myungsuensis]|uniref:O-succinylhomoserine sulfhydrylase n=1 Tax=Mucilaginibacter myungsuensis TaxID=649104 RepID=A0A929PUM4_9SPHI|nr:aminotransferase class I/II-fold pyridoxal phosphate-dependent enzyme [Mucilaginibacter myungsuensis]MBE9660274.1 aminotransferase class I/II-fold pyridoxal phosphate-dependent enzyme [Mucilaginibacter myungsuensis]MDN3600316.1 aminotransferase class I/II-fold pyridoxal phosphate-dependent enzyme [Mucilaginibacter myungsuensis]
MLENLDPITQAVRIQTERSQQNEHSTPLYLTSSFIFEEAETMRGAFADENDANIYSRFSNPNVDEFIAKMVMLEKAEDGFATATGMAAIFGTWMALLSQGDHMVCSSSVFGSTFTIVNKFLPKYGISCTLVASEDKEAWEAAIQPNTKMVYLETPTNPQLEVLDLEWFGQFSKKHNLILAVDNCFATPLLQRPIEFGADLVIHSATKWIDGQGRVLGGVVVGRADLIKDIYLFCRNTGPALSPFNAWVLSKSLETLDVRMERHCKTALAVAESLQSNPNVSWVKYPFLKGHPQYDIAIKQMSAGGGVLCFEVKGGVEAGRKFLDSLQLFSVTANLGDSRSIASHPASTTHSKLTEEERLAVGITPGLIRISTGLEKFDDIIADINQALELTK